MLGPALIAAHVVNSIPPRAAIIASIIVIAALTLRSNIQTWHWRDTESLFVHELDVNPNSAVAYDSLAMREIMQRRPDLAVSYAQQAVAVRPDFGQAWETLGSTLSATGKPVEAATAFKRAYELADSNDNAALSAGHYGAAMGQMGNRAEAETYLRRAIMLDPTLDRGPLQPRCPPRDAKSSPRSDRRSRGGGTPRSQQSAVPSNARHAVGSDRPASAGNRRISADIAARSERPACKAAAWPEPAGKSPAATVSCDVPKAVVSSLAGVAKHIAAI